jgi:polyisoprenoid-binding protein YceI
MKMKSAVLSFGLALFAGVAAHAQTSTWTIDPAHSGATFSIKHMGVSTVRGSFSGLKGAIVLDEKNITKTTVEATVDTTTVTTGMDARDKHLKSPDFFEVDKFPTMAFKSTKITDGGKKMVGDLTLHGVTKSVTLDVDGPAAPQKGQGGKIVSGFSATGTISRAEFGFGPKFAPPILGDDVKVTIDLEIDKQ